MVDDIQRVTPEPLPSPVEVEEAVKAGSSTAARPKSGDVTLFHPEYESLSYGPGSGMENRADLIQFGPKGGFEPHVWVGPADHPLLTQLYRDHPQLVEVTETPKVFVCADCGAEFGSIGAWRGHQRVHKGGPIKT